MLNLSVDMLEALERNFGAVPYTRLENEQQSLIIKEKLRQSFLARGNPQPDSFGNVFLDDEGILIINVVNGDSQLIKEIIQALGNEKYYIEKVAYSWAYLEAIRDVISTFMTQRVDHYLLENLVSVSANERSNSVVVELLDASEEAIKAFRQSIIDSPALVFRKVAGRPVPCVNVNPGDEIYHKDASNIKHYGSVGYRVSHNSTASIITAGHVFTGTTLLAHVDSTPVGFSRDYVISGNVDAALVGISGSNTPTNTIIYSGITGTLSTVITEPTLNAIAYKRGHVTFTTVGTVTKTSTTETVRYTGGNVTLTNQIEVLASSGIMGNDGDSGGVLFNSDKYTQGIYIAGSFLRTYGYFTKAGSIQSHFSVYRY